MGQLEIQMAQQVARENDHNLARRAELARVTTERGLHATVRPARWSGLRGWTDRLRLAHTAHPAH